MTEKTTLYVYQGQSILYEEIFNTADWSQLDSNKENRKLYIELTGKNLAKHVWTTTTGWEPESAGIFYLLVDHLGSRQVVCDANGNEITEGDVRYRTFGEYESGDEGEVSFTGKEMDDGTGLYYFNARYYDADTGRFTSVDPIKAGSNWYVYCHNNPLKYTDSDGQLAGAALYLIGALLDTVVVGGVLYNSTNSSIPLPPGFSYDGGGMVYSPDTGYLSIGEAWDYYSATGGTFNRSSFRSNLTKLTGIDPKDYQAHHIFPVAVEMRTHFFSNLGIDINNPMWGSWWEASDHRHNWSNWNKEWYTFIKTNPNANIRDTIMQATRMARNYGISFVGQHWTNYAIGVESGNTNAPVSPGSVYDGFMGIRTINQVINKIITISFK